MTPCDMLQLSPWLEHILQNQLNTYGTWVRKNLYTPPFCQKFLVFCWRSSPHVFIQRFYNLLAFLIRALERFASADSSHHSIFDSPQPPQARIAMCSFKLTFLVSKISSQLISASFCVFSMSPLFSANPKLCEQINCSTKTTSNVSHHLSNPVIVKTS